METTDSPCSTGQPKLSAEELKEQRRQKRLDRIERIRKSLGTAATRLAYSPSELAIACGRSPTWAYRMIYAGQFRVLNAEDGRMLVPRTEVDRFLASAAIYDGELKSKNGGEGNERTSK